MSRTRLAPLVVLSAMVPWAAQAQAQNPSFYLVNKGSEPIREVFATPAGLENWGRNRTEGKAIAPGARVAIRLRADGNCVFDLKITFADGRSETRRHLDTCKVDDVSVGAPGEADPADAATARTPSLRLVNRGKSPITEVYATPTSASKTSDNLLHDGTTLAPQATQLFRMAGADGCAYDLRVVFADHQSREKKDTDLCKTGDLPVQ